MIKPIQKVKVYLNKRHIGNLALTQENMCAFEYTSDYILNGVSISPFYLPLQSGVFIARADPFNGMFGIFNDSLPDGWGKLLTDRILRQNNIDLAEVSILHRLCLVGNSGIGALNYQPALQLDAEYSEVDLTTIANEVEEVLQNNYSGSISQLYQKGGSSGGARPKIFYEYEDEKWIVKFKASMDPINIGRIEYEYSKAARACGIIMPETKLFEEKYFGVKRFDLVGQHKYLVHSASGLLYASFRYPSIDYSDLIKATLALTQNMEEALKMFRQMVFNVLTFNKDDHAKNFSFILKDKVWELSPAYDLVYSDGFNGQHNTTINGKGNPDKADVFEVAKQTGLPLKMTNNIYDEVFENSTELVRQLSFYKLR